jgi:hypothetical protein
MSETLNSSYGLPGYPTGEVIGHCVCGSWPGGECLHCPITPCALKGYHLLTRDRINLLPWMRWCPYILVPKLTEEEWLEVTSSSVTEAERAEILKQKKR